MKAAAVTPAFIAYHRASQLQNVVRRIIVLASEARGLAVSRDTDVQLVFYPEGSQVIMAIEPAEADLQEAAAPDMTPTGERQAPGSRVVSYPEDIAVALEGPAADGMTLRFFPDGRSEPVTVRFEREGLEAVVLAMNPRTGRLQPVEAEP